MHALGKAVKSSRQKIREEMRGFRTEPDINVQLVFWAKIDTVLF